VGVTDANNTKSSSNSTKALKLSQCIVWAYIRVFFLFENTYLLTSIFQTRNCKNIHKRILFSAVQTMD